MTAVGLLEAFLPPILVAVAAFALGRVSDRHRRRRALGHLLELVGSAGRVKLVAPSFTVSSFIPREVRGRAALPTNVHLMPYAEGVAIGRLMGVLAMLAPKLPLVTATSDNHEEAPGEVVISIGGPSVNAVSAALLADNFPEFQIDYPSHIGHFREHTFSPKVNAAHQLTEDFGFLFFARDPDGASRLVVCGIWAFGTALAVSTLLSAAHRPLLSQHISLSRRALVVVHGTVHGLTTGRPQLVLQEAFGS